jgi:hypothetical protein
MTDDLRSPIVINGSVRRSFIFPGSSQNAIEFFQNYPQIFDLLPHISLVNQNGKNQFRLKYDTIELGLYHVEIFCEVEAKLDPANQTLYFLPAQIDKKVKAQAGLYSLSGQGIYTSQSKFVVHGQDTAVFYQLELSAQLPTPWGLRLMPELIRNRVAASITQHRIVEIADAFIERAIYHFQA